jgi:hypothetical protein
VGSAGFSAGTAGLGERAIAIDASGNVYVAYTDVPNGQKATVMKYPAGGGSWTAVGTAGFSAGDAQHLSIALDTGGTPYVVYTDWNYAGKATVMKYPAASAGWVNVGSMGFTDSLVDFISLAIDKSGTPYIAFNDFGYNQQATVMKYNSSNWTVVGNPGFSAGPTAFTSIAIDPSGAPYVAYEDIVNDQKVTVMKYGFPASINSVNTQTSTLTIFPNPTTGSFTLHISAPQNETTTITITNILGEKVKEFKAAANIDVAMQLDAAPGMYFVTANTQNETVTEKVAVK